MVSNIPASGVRVFTNINNTKFLCTHAIRFVFRYQYINIIYAISTRFYFNFKNLPVIDHVTYCTKTYAPKYLLLFSSKALSIEVFTAYG